MSFIEGLKKKVFGDDAQVQKAPRPSPYKAGSQSDKEFMTGYNRGLESQGKSPRRAGSMGKAYTGGGGGGAVKTDKGIGFDASTYRADAKPRGKVGSLNDFNPNRSGSSKASGKGYAGKALDYGVSKAKAGIGWMQDRGMELEKQNKKRSGRAPRGSQPPGYDGSYDMFGVGGFGGGGGGWQTQGTIISGGEAYEEVVPKRRKSRRRPARSESAGGFDMDYIPDSLKDMF